MANIMMIINAIVKPLTFICHQSFLTGIRIARAMPIYMSGEKNIFSNYRPFSILPQLPKIKNKLLEVKLSDFICKNKILIVSQDGL